MPSINNIFQNMPSLCTITFCVVFDDGTEILLSIKVYFWIVRYQSNSKTIIQIQYSDNLC